MSAANGCWSLSEPLTCWSHHAAGIGAAFAFTVAAWSISRNTSVALKLLEFDCWAMPVADVPIVAHRKHSPVLMIRFEFQIGNRLEVRKRMIIFVLPNFD